MRIKRGVRLALHANAADAFTIHTYEQTRDLLPKNMYAMQVVIHA